jgi:hypothetical protein
METDFFWAMAQLQDISSASKAMVFFISDWLLVITPAKVRKKHDTTKRKLKIVTTNRRKNMFRPRRGSFFKKRRAFLQKTASFL